MKELKLAESDVDATIVSLNEGAPTSDLDQLQSQYDEAVKRNVRIKAMNQLRPQAEKLIELSNQYQSYSQEIVALRERKRKAVQEASEKIPSMFRLDVDDENGEISLLYTENGVELPFHDKSIPRSRQYVASVILGMELMRDSSLRVIMLEDASLLDEETMKNLVEECNKRDFQLLVEEVEDGIEDVNVRMITEIKS
jgi:hypothetical protein